ncbi:MAG: DUF4345 family protein [Mycobacteriaceae bacterium]
MLKIIARVVLLSIAIATAADGMQICFAHFMGVGSVTNSLDDYSYIRGFGAEQLSMGLLFFAGVVSSRVAAIALPVGALHISAFFFGRVMSCLIDGVPSGLSVVICVVEGIAAVLLVTTCYINRSRLVQVW